MKENFLPLILNIKMDSSIEAHIAGVRVEAIRRIVNDNAIEL